MATERGAHKERFDIQFLRGVAVLVVVLFHAFPAAAPHGFLGVDVFFVISGFLVTRMILADIAAGNFSFWRFYLRRARRLLPAAYATFAGTTLLSYLFLTSIEWHAYLRQLLGALAFAANVILYRQTGYFDANVGTKPLLHIWSLSVEEQFYFALPLLLWLVTARSRGPTILIALLCSMGACFILVTQQPQYQSFAFYMLPTRAWELLIGSLCAWGLGARFIWVPTPVRWVALAVIFLVCVAGPDEPGPRFEALAVAVATAVVLLANDEWLPRTAAWRAVGLVGDWSYSLYLVHWPLFSFAYLAYLGRPPAPLIAALVPLAIGLAWLQYRFVETPFRRAPPTLNRRLIVPIGAGLVAIIALALPAVVSTTWPAGVDYFVNLGPTIGLRADCGESGEIDLRTCETSPMPSVAVLGDSNAMYVAAGLAADRVIGQSLVQVTKSDCAPAPGVSQIPAGATIEWARQCALFGQSAIDALIAAPTIKTVVISSALNSLQDANAHLLFDGVMAMAPDAVIDRMSAAIKQLMAGGKRIILVAPLPWPNVDPGECNLRLVERLVSVGPKSCDFNVADVKPAYHAVVAVLRAMAARTGAELFVPEDAICTEGICVTKIGDNFLYRDGGHLTQWGAARIMRQLGVVDAVSRVPPPTRPREPAGF